MIKHVERKKLQKIKITVFVEKENLTDNKSQRIMLVDKKIPGFLQEKVSTKEWLNVFGLYNLCKT